MPKQTTPAIEATGLTKYYGKTRGIEDLNLTVQRGEVFGFLGPNGAGKSTTINLLMGFRKPTRGTVRVLGQPTGPGEATLHEKVGYMPGEMELYRHLRGGEILRYFGSLRGGYDETYAAELAKRLDLDLDRKVADLSKGNKQKVVLVAAWMHRPELLILDEPTSGLDPIVQQEFRRLVTEATERGTTVFLSSHVLSEVESICDRVAIVKRGRLVTVQGMSALHERALRHVVAEFATSVPANSLGSLAGVTDFRVQDRTARFSIHGPIDPLTKSLARYKLKSLIIEHASLEELFFEEYEEGGSR